MKIYIATVYPKSGGTETFVFKRFEDLLSSIHTTWEKVEGIRVSAIGETVRVFENGRLVCFGSDQEVLNKPTHF